MESVSSFKEMGNFVPVKEVEMPKTVILQHVEPAVKPELIEILCPQEELGEILIATSFVESHFKGVDEWYRKYHMYHSPTSKNVVASFNLTFLMLFNAMRITAYLEKKHGGYKALTNEIINDEMKKLNLYNITKRESRRVYEFYNGTKGAYRDNMVDFQFEIYKRDEKARLEIFRVAAFNTIGKKKRKV